MGAAILEIRNDRHCFVSIVFYGSNKKVRQWTLNAEVADADKSAVQVVELGQVASQLLRA